MDNQKLTFFQRWKARKYRKIMAKNMNSYCKRLEDESAYYLNALEDVESRYGHRKVLYDAFSSIIYIKMSLADIFRTYSLYFNCPDKKEKNLHGRTLANHIWEFIQKVEKLLNNEFKTFTLPFKNAPDCDKEFNKAIADLKMWYGFLKKYHSEMGEIRHNASAHKDKNVKVQLEIMKKIDGDYSDLDICMVWCQCFLASLISFENLLAIKRKEAREESIPTKENITIN